MQKLACVSVRPMGVLSAMSVQSLEACRLTAPTQTREHHILMCTGTKGEATHIRSPSHTHPHQPQQPVEPEHHSPRHGPECCFCSLSHSHVGGTPAWNPCTTSEVGFASSDLFLRLIPRTKDSEAARNSKRTSRRDSPCTQLLENQRFLLQHCYFHKN